jgi:hypothetical protein
MEAGEQHVNDWRQRDLRQQPASVECVLDGCRQRQGQTPFSGAPRGAETSQRGAGPVPLVMEVHPSVPAKSIPEFIVYAKPIPAN